MTPSSPVKALGADHLINYRTEPESSRPVKAPTGGRGADLIVEIGGAGTLVQSIRAVQVGGTIVMIGVVAGAAASNIPVPLVVAASPDAGRHARIARRLRSHAARLHGGPVAPGAG
jgi:NADPH:quinone reductase-like Zn-dependent oxidoreductase